MNDIEQMETTRVVEEMDETVVQKPLMNMN
jgi:hypothetical protein